MQKNTDELWEELLGQLRLTINNEAQFESSIKPLRLKSWREDSIIIEAPNGFILQLAQTRQYPQIFAQTLQNLTEKNYQIEFVAAQPTPLVANPQNTSNYQSVVDKAASVSREQRFKNSNLTEQYTFDNFVVGSHNKLAHATAWRVAESPGITYNPLFIYGGVGLGKTHLMKAIGSHLLTHRDETFKVTYISSESFTNHLIEAIKEDKTMEFKNRYRRIDLLLIDDIQFMGGKERTQEEFFHTFNELYEAGKQIVITSDRPPHQIATLEDRLRSRFEMGLICDIQAPDFETRIAILKKKAEMQNLEVPDEVLHYIAQVYKSNVRELEGALTRLMAHTSLIGSSVPNLGFAQSVLGQMPEKELTPQAIQETVAEFYHLSLSELKGKSRSKTINIARQVSIYLCCELTQLSTPKIGEIFGGRDHTTIIHARDQIKKKMTQDPKLQTDINELMARFK